MVPLATGSQTAGSIIRPASYCGVVGYKPSFGKVMLAGVKALSPSLDTLGCFGRSVGDVALGVAAMSNDLSLAEIDQLHNKPRVAICKTKDWSFASKETAGALALARFTAEAIAKGVVQDISLPAACKDLTLLQTRIMSFEMARALIFERTRYSKKLSPQLLQQLSEGAQIPYEQYQKDLMKAQAARFAIAQLFENEVDILIAPSAPGEAPLAKEGTGNPVFCRGWTLSGLPCINLNVSSGPNGLPVGVQLIAGPGKDRFLLSAARAFAQALPDPVLRDQA
jgi:Asp-tRNA(Asn)/Glu-tRNA(Gln) amidotransferase A subunit family amidase